jgi:hypothetical protein
LSLTIRPLREYSVTLLFSMLATSLKPSHLVSNTHSAPSNGASMSVANMGCNCLGTLDGRATAEE